MSCITLSLPAQCISMSPYYPCTITHSHHCPHNYLHTLAVTNIHTLSHTHWVTHIPATASAETHTSAHCTQTHTCERECSSQLRVFTYLCLSTQWVYSVGLVVVSARTNKRHHHQLTCICGAQGVHLRQMIDPVDPYHDPRHRDRRLPVRASATP